MLNPKQLAQSVLGTASAPIYTATGVRTRIDALTVANANAAARTFSLWLVPSGGSAADATLVVKDFSIAGGKSVRVLQAIGQWINPGGSLHMVASAATSLTATLSGVEQTDG